MAGPSSHAVDGAVITVSLTYGGGSIGRATSDATGLYAIESVQAELGTKVFVSAAKEGYNTSTVYGVLDEVDEEVTFGLLQTGPNAELDWSDRRLQPDSVFPSAPYFDGLLPD